MSAATFPTASKRQIILEDSPAGAASTELNDN